MAAAALRRRLERTARRAAQAIGALIVRRRSGLGRIAAQRKGEGDFVTGVDVAAERRLRRLLLAEHPDHGFLGEESGATALDAPYVWVVDPIDGTSNYLHGLAHYGVSIACLHEGMPIAAAIHAMPDDVVYSAAAGLGARRGRGRLQLARTHLDDNAVLGMQWLRGVCELPWLPRLLGTGARVRVQGSTVTQLCDVAAGRLDGNVQEQGHVWDIAAASLIVIEAGGRFTCWNGAPILPFATLSAAEHYPSLAAPPGVHEQLVDLLRRP